MYTYLDEIINKLNEGTNIEDCGIEVNSYLDVALKELAIKGDNKEAFGIANACLNDTNGFFCIDFVVLEVLIVVELMRNYTNIKPPKNEKDIEKWGVVEYDLIKKYGIDQYVINHIPQKEYNLFIKLLDRTIAEKLNLLNSYQRLFNLNIDKILKKIPSERKLKNMLKKIEGFDDKKLKTITDLFNFSKKKELDSVRDK